MDVLLETIDAKLRTWEPETAEEVRRQLQELVDLADSDVLDLSRSRQVEQEVLDLLDEPTEK